MSGLRIRRPAERRAARRSASRRAAMVAVASVVHRGGDDVRVRRRPRDRPGSAARPDPPGRRAAATRSVVDVGPKRPGRRRRRAPPGSRPPLPAPLPPPPPAGRGQRSRPCGSTVTPTRRCWTGSPPTRTTTGGPSSSHASPTAPPPSGSPTPQRRRSPRACGPSPRPRLPRAASRPAGGQWWDPAGRGVGQTPTPRTGQARIDAHLWVSCQARRTAARERPGRSRRRTPTAWRGEPSRRLPRRRRRCPSPGAAPGP